MPKYIKTPEERQQFGIERVLRIFRRGGRERELKERVLHLERVNSILRGRLEREGKSTIFKNGLSYRE